MRVLENTKFKPLLDSEGRAIRYVSVVQVEVSNQIFATVRSMTVSEYNDTYPVLRDFIHDSLRTDIMTQIRKKLFEGVTS